MKNPEKRTRIFLSAKAELAMNMSDTFNNAFSSDRSIRLGWGGGLLTVIKIVKRIEIIFISKS